MLNVESLGQKCGPRSLRSKNTNGLEGGFCKVCHVGIVFSESSVFFWVKDFEPYFPCFLRKRVTNQNSGASHSSFWISLSFCQPSLVPREPGKTERATQCPSQCKGMSPTFKKSKIMTSLLYQSEKIMCSAAC